ncbi:hypothetical protein KIH74_05835 [Kineosporia sp. J2-2]|uniref:Uncharacterized protein n=1 Tax=Kineosporia corallincola TaxID=2835133 RepID=A0ABS5TBJ0_9ACTN|nr:hypothetical protein [Kineosporia corallincola]MBT0768435.1 hypothetical protein [Kineosporia corallincola]
MRRALIGIGVAGTLVVGGAASANAAVAPQTAAANTSCATVAEFGKIKVGMSKARVAKIIGSTGTKYSYDADVSGYGQEVRTYKVCNAPSAVVQVVYYSKQDLPATGVGWASGKAWVEAWA